MLGLRPRHHEIQQPPVVGEPGRCARSAPAPWAALPAHPGRCPARPPGLRTVRRGYHRPAEPRNAALRGSARDEGLRRRNGLRRVDHRRQPGVSRAQGDMSGHRRGEGGAAARRHLAHLRAVPRRAARRGGAEPAVHRRLRGGGRRCGGGLRRRADTAAARRRAGPALPALGGRECRRAHRRRVHGRGQQVDRADRQWQLGRPDPARVVRTRARAPGRRRVLGGVQPGVPA